MPSYGNPSRIHSQCCQCGFFVDIYRCGMAHWLLCEGCGTQHVLKSPDKEGDAYSLLAYAEGPRIRPISSEMLAAHWEEEARLKKEHAERLLFRALPVEQRHAIRRKQAAESRRRDKISAWSLVWEIPALLLIVPLFTPVVLILGLYDLITGSERRARKKIQEQLADCLLGYRFVGLFHAEKDTGKTGLPGLTRQSIESLSCAYCHAEKSLTYTPRYGDTCPNCGAEKLVIVEATGK